MQPFHCHSQLLCTVTVDSSTCCPHLLDQFQQDCMPSTRSFLSFCTDCSPVHSAFYRSVLGVSPQARSLLLTTFTPGQPPHVLKLRHGATSFHLRRSLCWCYPLMGSVPAVLLFRSGSRRLFRTSATKPITASAETEVPHRCLYRSVGLSSDADDTVVLLHFL